jgi:DNA-binding MarR family transcriptional regulator
MRTNNLIAVVSTLRYQAIEYLMIELRSRGIEDLVPSQGALLAMLYSRRGRATMKELVTASRRNKSTMTEMAKALERRGYLARERDPRDARGVVLALTPKAWGTRFSFERISDSLLKTAWGGMPQERRELLMVLLGEVEANLEKARKKA